MNPLELRRRVLVRLSLTLGVLVVVALVALRYHWRWDTTDDHRYTLAPITVDVLQGLPTPVTVRAVFTDGLPARFARLRQQSIDVLDEFSVRSGGKFRYTVVDPDADSLLKSEMREAGMQEIEVAERTRGGAVSRRGFLGLELRFGDDLELVPLVTSAEGLEYEIMLRIRKLAGLRSAVGVIQGVGTGKVFMLEPTGGQSIPRSGFAEVFPSFANELDRLARITGLDGVARIPDSVGCVVVAAPRALDSITLSALQDWVNRGGSLLVLAPALDAAFMPDDVRLHRTPPASAALLARFGVSVDSLLLLDRRHGAAFFGASPYGVPYPPFIEIREDGFGTGQSITSGLGSLSLPWTASLDTFPVPGLRSTSVLLRSSDAASRVSLPIDLAPRDARAGETWPSGIPGRRMLAVERVLRVASGRDAHLVVIANSLFVTDFYAGWSAQGGETGGLENLAFVLAAIDHLTEDPRWGALRTKQMVNRPISEAGDHHRYTWMAFCLGAPVFLFSLAGVWYLGRRRWASRAGNRA